MNRRRFFQMLGLAAATAAIDPERLLWTPGARTHILPPPQGWVIRPPLEFHKDAFAMVWDNDPAYQEAVAIAAKRLADEIDRRAIEQFYLKDLSGVRYDVIYGVGTLKPLDPSKCFVVTDLV